MPPEDWNDRLDPYSDGNERDPLHDEPIFEDFELTIDGIRYDGHVPDPPFLHPNCPCSMVPIEGSLDDPPAESPWDKNLMKGEPLEYIRETAKALGHSIEEETGKTIQELVRLNRIREAHLRETGEAILASLGWIE